MRRSFGSAFYDSRNEIKTKVMISIFSPTLQICLNQFFPSSSNVLATSFYLYSLRLIVCHCLSGNGATNGGIIENLGWKGKTSRQGLCRRRVNQQRVIKNMLEI